MQIKTMQLRVQEIYILRGYTSDLPTLGLGLCEEAGEIAKAINLLNPHYVPTPGKPPPDDLPHELADLIVYACGIASAAGIDLDQVMENKLPFPEFPNGN